MTHAEFAKEVMTEWNLGPSDFCQACYCQWYHYTIQVDGKTKIIGEYKLVDSKPMFVLIKKDGTEKVWEAK